MSGLSVVWPTGHLQTWDYYLFALLAGRVLWGPALQKPSFLVLLPRRFSHPHVWDHSLKQSQGSMILLWRSPHPPGADCERDRRGPESFAGSLNPGWIQEDSKKSRFQGSWNEGPTFPAQCICSSGHLDSLTLAVSICHLLDAPISFLRLIPSGYSLFPFPALQELYSSLTRHCARSHTGTIP